MKRLINTSLLLLVLSSNINSQNWFPTNVGNEWQYITLLKEFILGSYFLNYGLKNSSINQDTLINKNLYFKWSRLPNHWLRYDSTESKLLIWFDEKDTLYRDFSIPADTTIYLFDPSTNQSKLTTITNTTINFIDSSFLCKKFSFTDPIWYSNVHEYFSPDIGFIHYSSISQFLGTQWYDHFLIEAKIKGQYYLGDHYPEINADSVSIIRFNRFFIETVQVKHFHNHIFPSSSSDVGLNFIDSVYFKGIYAKGDSVIINPPVSAHNINLEDWYVNFTLNQDLLDDGFTFKYKIEAVDKGLFPHRSIVPDSGYFTAVFDTGSTSIATESEKLDFRLLQNYPNPFNPSTTISYNFNTRGYVKLMVYDIKGELISILVNKEQESGYYEVKFPSENSKLSLPSGIYLYRIEIISEGGSQIFSDMKKMILIK